MRLLKHLLRFIIVIVILIAIPVGLIYGFLYDATTPDITYDDSFSTSTYFGDLMAKSLNDTRTTAKMDVQITQDDLNNVIHAALKDNADFPSDIVNPIYVDISENTYIFGVCINAKSYFKTRIQIYTTLDVVKDEATGEDNFVFTVTNVKLGRASGFTKIAFNMLGKYVSDDTLEESLSGNGLHMDVTLSEGNITYTEANLISDMKTLMGDSDSDATKLIGSVMEDFLSNDYVTLDTTGKIDATINLEPFASNKTGLLDSSKEQNLDLDGCITKLKALYNAGTIDSDHMQSVYTYLIYGYDNADDDTQTYLEGKDFSAAGISDVKTYEGIVEKSNKQITDIIGEQSVSPLELMVNKQITFMSETQLNQYVAGSGFIGFSYLLTDSTKEVANYITVDNFYCNIYNKDDIGYFTLVAGVNFNGYETSVIFNMTQDDTVTGDYQVGFKMEDIYFGEYETQDSLSDFLFKMMASSLEGDSTIQIDYDTKTVVVDFSSSLDETTKLAVAAIGTPKMKIEGSGLSDEGKVIAYIA